MLTVNWMKCGDDGHWCSLENLTLTSISAKAGVYVIWHAGQEGRPGRVIKVGQGDIAARLGAHRMDTAITKYRIQGTLRVTWAALQASQLDGVECYLGNRLNPLVGDRFPVCTPIAVNLPWAA